MRTTVVVRSPVGTLILADELGENLVIIVVAINLAQPLGANLVTKVVDVTLPLFRCGVL